LFQSTDPNVPCMRPSPFQRKLTLSHLTTVFSATGVDPAACMAARASPQVRLRTAFECLLSNMPIPAFNVEHDGWQDVELGPERPTLRLAPFVPPYVGYLFIRPSAAQRLFGDGPPQGLDPTRAGALNGQCESCPSTFFLPHLLGAAWQQFLLQGCFSLKTMPADTKALYKWSDRWGRTDEEYFGLRTVRCLSSVADCCHKELPPEQSYHASTAAASAQWSHVGVGCNVTLGH
jgi:hypothetical protein